MVDCIHLRDLRCYGYTGALPEEQVLGQWFEVELRLWLDLSLAGGSDRLEETLDYRQVIETVQRTVQTARFALLERLAAEIVEQVLSLPRSPTTPVIQQIDLRLSKLAAPIPDFGGRITVELTRRPIQPQIETPPDARTGNQWG